MDKKKNKEDFFENVVSLHHFGKKMCCFVWAEYVAAIFFLFFSLSKKQGLSILKISSLSLDLFFWGVYWGEK